MNDTGSETASGLKRVLTFPWLLLYGLGSTVGAGIYVLTGVVAGRAGALAPLAFVLASFLALFTALSFAELSARYPRAGGTLVYVREGLGSPALSTLVGLGSSVAGMISAATVSLGFVAYFAELAQVSAMILLPLVVGGVGVIAAWGVKESIVAAGLVTLVEVGGLFVVLAYGGISLADGTAVDLASIWPTEGWGAAWSAVFHSAVLCFYAFLGFEDIVNVAEEVRDAPRQMPRAIMWTLGISTLLYVAVTSVSVLVVPVAELGNAEAPLALVLERSGGPAQVLSLIALVAMLNGALVQVVMASRILFSLARNGSLPDWLGYIHPRTRTPVWATLVVTLAVGVLSALLPLSRLAAATASVALGVFVLVNLSMLRLLIRERKAEAEPALPIAIPLIGAVASSLFLGLEIVTTLGL